jgi:pyroglutamyl-peptidase
MINYCLLTSFQTWLPHQKSNSSDDLLDDISTQTIPNLSLSFLRKLPVDITLASQKIIAEIDRSNFKTIICCGMAESRTRLTVESNANNSGEQIYSRIDLEDLVRDLTFTGISHDAGKFVCEGLYFQTLNYLRNKRMSTSCIFVHVPRLTAENRKIIRSDFLAIVQKLTQDNYTIKQI